MVLFKKIIVNLRFSLICYLTVLIELFCIFSVFNPFMPDFKSLFFVYLCMLDGKM